MPDQPAIQDEVMSLVGSTDCLASGGTALVDDKLLNQTKVLETAATDRTVSVGGLTTHKCKTSKGLVKSKLCDKKQMKKKVGNMCSNTLGTSLNLFQPSSLNRTKTFIAMNNTPLHEHNATQTVEANGTVVLLKRDNTFDITDNNLLAAAEGTHVKQRVQETPLSRQESSNKVRPKCLQLDQHFDSPARFSLDNFPASTPMAVDSAYGGGKMPVNLIDNTFLFEQNTPKNNNVTRTVGTSCGLNDKEVQLIRFDSTMDVTKTIHTGNQTVTLPAAPATLSVPPSIAASLEADLNLIQCVNPRESLGLFSASEIAMLEESLSSHQNSNNFIKMDDSKEGCDKTLVPDAQPHSKSTDELLLLSEAVATDDKVAPLNNNNYHPHHNYHLAPPRDPFDNAAAAATVDISKVAQRLSFSKFPDISLSCSFELEDVTNPLKTGLGTTTVTTPTQTDSNSYEMEESLGILTPDQMKDFGDTTASRPSLDLCLLGVISGVNLRVEQTPSPEELPLDPLPMPNSLHAALIGGGGGKFGEMERSEFSEMTESGLMKSSGHSKGSMHLESSVITSVTSITSLDGYQGDGEMSRPASRNAVEYSGGAVGVGGSSGSGAGTSLKSPTKRPSPLPMLRQQLMEKDVQAAELNRADVLAEAAAAAAAEIAVLGGHVVRRPDPMTDSDFFTESDADDIFHRGGDRRAQIIDGQLYGQQVLQNVIVVQGAGNGVSGGETSGMESSGVFTDNEPMREELQFDMSPDDRSTETVQSSGNSQLIVEQQAEEEEDLDGTIRFEDARALDAAVGEGIGESIIDNHNSSVASGDDKMDIDGEQQSGAEEGQQQQKQVVVSNQNLKPAAAAMTTAAAKRLNPTSGRSSSSSPPIIKKKMVEQQQAGVVTISAKVQMAKVQAVAIAKKTPNKWDAVMNKIAQNQTATAPKNYNEVKSRVNSAPKCRSSVDGDGEQPHHLPVKGLTVYNSRNSPQSKRAESCVTNPSKR